MVTTIMVLMPGSFPVKVLLPILKCVTLPIAPTPISGNVPVNWFWSIQKTIIFVIALIQLSGMVPVKLFMRVDSAPPLERN
eukprot:5007843-Amphidinium_carterae.2